ncbi:cobalamin synthesis protein, partial [Cupriavidus basilensis OR16]
GEIDFDRVVIETTGVANPGPVAQTFFMDDEIAQRYLLDAVITLVDAKHANQQLDKQEEAQRQVGFADAIFMTKADLVPEGEIADLRHRLLHMNPRAPVRTAHFGEAPIDTIFDLRGFNLNEKTGNRPGFPACRGRRARSRPRARPWRPYGHGHQHDHHHHHNHTDRIGSFVFRSEKPFNYAKLEEFLSGILSVYGEKLLRYKGVLYMDAVDRKVVFQGVHQLMGSDIGTKWGDETPGTKMVFIGVDLPKDAILKGLATCLA